MTSGRASLATSPPDEALGTSEELAEWVIVTHHPGDELSGDSGVLQSVTVFRKAGELAVDDLELDVVV